MSLTTDTDLADALETAVAKAVAPRPPVTHIVARAICSLYGPRPGCYCGKGTWKGCHSVQIYSDMAVAVVFALREAGIIDKGRE